MSASILLLFPSQALAKTPAPAAENIAVPSWITSLQPEDLDKNTTCVALAVYYESRGESLRGQRAVASVVMNRTRSGRFPATACGVILQRGQFSFMGKSALSPKGSSWEIAKTIAAEFIARETADLPYLYFTNSSRLRGFRIGNHVFR